MVEADYCDETITLRDAAGNDLPNQKRYTCNGAVNPEEESLNVLRDLLGIMQGRTSFA
jgi:predicted phage tail protein